MFGSLFKHKKQSGLGAGCFKGFTDWHSHILPDVDDGFSTLENSLDALRAYEQAGVVSVWLTPHIMEDYPNTVFELQEKFVSFKEAYFQDNLSRNAGFCCLNLNLSAENMIDNLFLNRLEKRELLPLGEGRLLVETSYYSAPMNFEAVLREIQAIGLIPVLAHPERYMYMDNAYYARLKRMGILFQLDLPSLYGMYGRLSYKKALYLQKKGWYDMTGTDLHSIEAWNQMTK